MPEIHWTTGKSKLTLNVELVELILPSRALCRCDSTSRLHCCSTYCIATIHKKHGIQKKKKDALWHTGEKVLLILLAVKR